MTVETCAPAVECDDGLEQACKLAAEDVARELGRQAAREWIEQMTRKQREAS